MSAGLKNCKIPTIAPVAEPNIKPTMSKAILFLILKLANMTTVISVPAPKVAAKTNSQSAKKPILIPAKTQNATPKLAPELIPKTKGPASGFWKNVCICKPLSERAIPTKSAVIVRGKRNLRIMVVQLCLTSGLSNKTLITSSKGICTEPKDKSNKNRKINSPKR